MCFDVSGVCVSCDWCYILGLGCVCFAWCSPRVDMSVGCLCVIACVVRSEWNVRYVGFCWLCVLHVVSYVACLVGVCDCDLCLAVFERLCVRLVELSVRCETCCLCVLVPHCGCCVYSLNCGLCELCAFMSCDVCCFLCSAVCVLRGSVCSVCMCLWVSSRVCGGCSLSVCCVWLYVWYVVVVLFCVRRIADAGCCVCYEL